VDFKRTVAARAATVRVHAGHGCPRLRRTGHAAQHAYFVGTHDDYVHCRRHQFSSCAVCAKGSRWGRSSPECKLGASLAARGIQIRHTSTAYGLHPHAQQRDAPKVPWAKLIRGTCPKEALEGAAVDLDAAKEVVIGCVV